MNYSRGGGRVVPWDWPEIFYSGPPLELTATTMGRAHYSYRFALSKFIDALRGARVPCRELQMPEYYGTPAALPRGRAPSEAASGKPIHLIFRSTEDIRLLKFGYNIACFAWEFDVLGNYTGYNGSLLMNQSHMLGLCQEIWTPCSFTKSILETHGFDNVSVIPSPIAIEPAGFLSRREAFASLCAVPTFPMNFNPNWRMNHTVAANRIGQRPLLEWLGSGALDPQVYLTVLNPEDDRKNIDAMVTAFFEFARDEPDVILIVKLVTSLERLKLSVGEFMHNVIGRRIRNGSGLQGGNIYFITDYLPQKTMQLLYRASHYYLCASIGEGQNLPLMEAMANGVVPIAPRHTAMADYLDDDNSIAVDFTKRDNFLDNMAPTGFGFRSFPINYSSPADVLKALRETATISRERHQTLSDNAARKIQEDYSQAAVIEKIEERIRSVVASSSEGSNVLS